MLAKIEDRRRRGRHRMRWLDGSIDSTDMRLSKLREMEKDREAWRAAVPRVTKSLTRVTEEQHSRTVLPETSQQSPGSRRPRRWASTQSRLRREAPPLPKQGQQDPTNSARDE